MVTQSREKRGFVRAHMVAIKILSKQCPTLSPFNCYSSVIIWSDRDRYCHSDKSVKCATLVNKVSG